MKKTLLSLFLMSCLGASAQLPNGTPAPDFTVTDIYGNSHTLSAYLNSGKDVLLNVSAVWCGPCWIYHNTHALADFYEAYGPNGSNEAMVLYVEGDPSTPVSGLFGSGGGTLGDWTEGTPYPIIDSAAILNLYNVVAFPTLYRICANTGTVTEISRLSALNLRNNLNGSCGTLSGVQNHAKLSVGDIYPCETEAGFSAKIKNFGSNNITTATLVLKENGNVVATQNFTGNVSQFSSGTVTFSSLDLNPAADYVVEIQSINGQANHNESLGISSTEVIVAQQAQSTNLQVRVYTDNYPAEATWRIKNSAGTVVASGGPYSSPSNGGGVNANTTKIHNLTIPYSYDCYTVELMDSYGDGWGYNSASAPISGLEIFDGSTSLVFVDGAVPFSSSAPQVRPGAFKFGTASTNDSQLTKFSAYPNPSTGIINITTSEIVNVNVIDVAGKVVYRAEGLDNNATLNLSTLETGIYLLQVSGETIKTTEKLIIK